MADQLSEGTSPDDYASVEVSELYLKQLVRSLTSFDGVDDLVPVRPNEVRGFFRRRVFELLHRALEKRDLEIVRHIRFDYSSRELGRDWPVRAKTMIGVRRLEHLSRCVKAVIAESIPGDLVETGVWRGGASIMMRAALEAYGDRSRAVWCADSFEGMPVPDTARFPQDAGTTWHLHRELSVSLEQVKANFAAYDLLDERVHFLKGWFKDTLPNAPIEAIAILRLDGDLYESTMEALTQLYDRVSPGGFVIVDDYGIPEDTTRRAVTDFRRMRGIAAPIEDIDGWGAYWRVD